MDEADLTDLADHAPLEEPVRTPASGRGRGRGFNGRGGVNRKKAAANARKAKGVRRTRKYDNPKVQAAWERMQELKAQYSSVAGALKPVVEEIADRSIRTLETDPRAHEQGVEHGIVTKQLEETLRKTVEKHDIESKYKLANLAKSTAIHNDISRRKFQAAFEDAEERFFDGQLNKLRVLEFLHDANLPLDTPDTRFNYKVVPDDKFKILTEKFVFYDDNGIEVPYPGRLMQERAQALDVAKTPQKGTTRRAAAAAADSPAPAMIHHTSVLMETMNQGLEPSSEPSSPREGSKMEQVEGEGDVDPNHDRDKTPDVGEWQPKLPNGATEPDAFGVRTVVRKANPNAFRYVNNRIIVPPLYEFEPHEIGYRDSYNSSAQNATEKNRGPYLDNPNTPFFHTDPVLGRYDCKKHKDGDLDEDLIKKHGLHPKYGLFLNSSRNHPEPPAPHVSGQHPNVILTTDGKRHELSRSVRTLHVKQELKFEAVKRTMSEALAAFCISEDINPEEVAPTESETRDYRMKLCENYRTEVDPDVDVHMSGTDLPPVPFPAISSQELAEQAPESYLRGGRSPIEEGAEVADVSQEEDNEAAIQEVEPKVSMLLDAAEQVEETERAKAVGEEASRRQSISRPYDAVRDIFAGGEEHQPSPPRAATQPPLNVFGLSLLAEMAMERIDTTMQPEEVAAQPQANPPLDPMMFQSGEPARPSGRNDFFQTALNGSPTEKPRSSGWQRDEYMPPREAIEASGSKYHTPIPPPPPRLAQPEAPMPHQLEYARYPEEREDVPPMRMNRHHSMDNAQPNHVLHEPAYPPPSREHSEYLTPPGPAPPHPYQNGYSHPEPPIPQYPATSYAQQFIPMPPPPQVTFPGPQHPARGYEHGYGPGTPTGPPYPQQPYGYAHEHHQPSVHYQGAPTHSNQPHHSPPAIPPGPMYEPQSRRYSEPYGPGGGVAEYYPGSPIERMSYSNHQNNQVQATGPPRSDQYSPKSGTIKRGESRGRGRPRLSNVPVAPPTVSTPRSLAQMRGSHPDVDPNIDAKFKKLQPKEMDPETYQQTMMMVQPGDRMEIVRGKGKGELRTIQYNHAESIKDYPAVEPPPASGPVQIRAWHTNKVKRGSRSGGSNGNSPTEG